MFLLGEEFEKNQFALAPLSQEDVDEDLLADSPMESSLRRYERFLSATASDVA